MNSHILLKDVLLWLKFVPFFEIKDLLRFIIYILMNCSYPKSKSSWFRVRNLNVGALIFPTYNAVDYVRILKELFLLWQVNYKVGYDGCCAIPQASTPFSSLPEVKKFF